MGNYFYRGKDSKLKHINLSGGFGDIYENKFYTSMLSVRNTENIMLENINFYQNNHLNFPNYYDDLLHVIYSDKVKIISSSFFNSTGDAVDIDVSDVVIKRLLF